MRRAALLLAPLVGLGACGGDGGSGGDAEQSTRTVTRPARAKEKVEVAVIKGKGNDTKVVIPVSIRGHGPYPFIVDTGASQTLVSPALVTRLRLPRSKVKQRFGTANGGVLPAVQVVVDRWTAEGLDLPRQRIITVDTTTGPTRLGFGGLLGSDVLSTFGRVTIDYRRGVLEFGTELTR
jgi:hypothetical protein